MTLHVRELPKDPRLSAPAPLEFAWESFGSVMHELVPLMARHWREVESHPEQLLLTPDWAAFCRLEMAGLLWLLTARREGRLMGYHCLSLYPHLHYSVLCALTNGLYLAREERQGWNGIKLLKLALERLRAQGIKLHDFGYKISMTDHVDYTPLMKRLGYQPEETTYRIML